ncbi:MAG: hypothetical protein O3A80_01990 [bacterium]|nr:hypothetical protein [bacterium]
MKFDRKHLPYLAFLVAFLGIFFWGLNYGDLIGHDYNYFFPKLLDGNWHFMRQGLAPFLYTPHYCGGFPEFGNPQSMYYSLLQLLSLTLDLWIAAQLVMGIAMLIGYWGWYLFGRDILKMSLDWSHVFALIVTAHGFYLMHMMAGHIIYHTMPLIGLMLWLLLERSRDTKRSLILKASAFGCIAANSIHSGGFMVGVFGALTLLLFLPFVIILHDRKGLRTRIAACTVAALLMTGGKVFAIASVMRFFPRNLPFNQLPEGSSTLGYIATTLWGFPQSEGLYKNYGIPDWGALHEYSMYLSPVVALGLLFGLWLVIQHRKNMNIPMVLITIALLLFFIQLIQGHGIFVDWLKHVPVFKSLRMNTRFVYPLSLLLSAAGVWSLQRTMPFASRITYYASLLTILAFLSAYVPMLIDVAPPRSLHYTEVQYHLERNAGFLELNVEQNIDMRGLGQAEFVPLFVGANHVYCEEPLLWGDKPQMEELKAGDVYLGWDDHLNLYNPACFIYPEVNDCEPGDRIAVDDMENFKSFIAGEKTEWNVPIFQRILNWISILTLLAAIGIVVPWKR